MCTASFCKSSIPQQFCRWPYFVDGPMVSGSFQQLCVSLHGNHTSVQRWPAGPSVATCRYKHINASVSGGACGRYRRGGAGRSGGAADSRAAAGGTGDAAAAGTRHPHRLLAACFCLGRGGRQNASLLRFPSWLVQGLLASEPRHGQPRLLWCLFVELSIAAERGCSECTGDMARAMSPPSSPARGNANLTSLNLITLNCRHSIPRQFESRTDHHFIYVKVRGSNLAVGRRGTMCAAASRGRGEVGGVHGAGAQRGACCRSDCSAVWQWRAAAGSSDSSTARPKARCTGGTRNFCLSGGERCLVPSPIPALSQARPAHDLVNDAVGQTGPEAPH